MKVMERPVHQNLHILSQFTYSWSLKMATKLFLSVSVFSFFFSRSSFLSFLHSLHFCFSTFPYRLFTHTIDKNCIFLICNGLLVFLAKYSGLVRSLSFSSHQDIESRSKSFIENSQSELSIQMMKEPIAVPESIEEKENVVAMEEGHEDQDYCFTNETETEKEILVEDKGQEEGSDGMASNQEQQKEEEHQEEEEEEEENELEHVVEHEEENNWPKDLIEQKEEDDDDNEEVGNGVLSTEELNKKFDEFIRRMKEELRIEAQGQLIMV